MFLYFVRALRFRVCTMNSYGRRFNLYFWPAVLLLLAGGCALLNPEGRETAALRIHIETGVGTSGSGRTISVMRSQPVMVHIAGEPILTEADVTSARLVETPGGFAVEVKFGEIAGWALEQNSAVNPGKHLAIFAQWTDKPADGRWLAAPSIARRIAGGTLVFTPDASREEAEQLVKGLNNEARKNAVVKSKE